MPPCPLEACGLPAQTDVETPLLVPLAPQFCPSFPPPPPQPWPLRRVQGPTSPPTGFWESTSGLSGVTSSRGSLCGEGSWPFNEPPARKAGGCLCPHPRNQVLQMDLECKQHCGRDSLYWPIPCSRTRKLGKNTKHGFASWSSFIPGLCLNSALSCHGFLYVTHTQR